jgi:hypothetical protein
MFRRTESIPVDQCATEPAGKRNEELRCFLSRRLLLMRVC